MNDLGRWATKLTASYSSLRPTDGISIAWEFCCRVGNMDKTWLRHMLR